jgi:dihydroorotate dehydrogenase
MYSLVRKALFQFSPEISHEISMDSLDALYHLGILGMVSPAPISAPKTIMGISFPNSVGLAAGLDKNGEHIGALSALGFGFIEVGTVTPRPQPGNPKPRLFRLPQANAIINRMGFNNKGVDYLLAQVKRSNFDGVLGINIGKNKDTPAEQAIDDYRIGLEKVYDAASYVTINLSSPNTPGLRDLQFGEPLKVLLHGLKETQMALAKSRGVYKPITVKIAPDMDLSDIQDVAKTLIESGIDGVIATNTTISRQGVANLRFGNETGGLSGEPVFDAANHTLTHLNEALKGQIPIIGVGGISSAADAVKKTQLGADLVQIYTGFIYQGPRLIRESAHAIAGL